jgi:acyl-CoA synthetase (AMP-forming)/AMP-acid ligase II
LPPPCFIDTRAAAWPQHSEVLRGTAAARDGYYTFLGRKSDLIISGGFNIYPREPDSGLPWVVGS